MRKLLSLLLAAMLLPLTSVAMDLEPNQLLMGHYLTDDLATSGWGSNALEGLATVATDLDPDELALYKVGDIVAFRVGLFLATPISRVFVIPVTPDGDLLMDQMTEWPCEVSGVKGWNLITLDTPYSLSNLPEGYSLRIGFDYEQATKTTKPLSVVKVGTTYSSYHYINGEWKKLILSTKGNLSLQCLVESDNFPEYVIRVNNISFSDDFVQIGTDIIYSFDTRNLGVGSVPAEGCTYEVAIDGVVINTLTNPTALSNQFIYLGGVINTDNLAAGKHTFTVTPVAVNGETFDEPTVFEATFVTYEYGFERQMHLVEQFTSTNCTYCPQGTANLVNLTNMRDDVAWVAHHEYMSGSDPFQTAQTDSLPGLEGIDGYPEATFDRTVGISSESGVYAVITNLAASTMSQFLDYVTAQAPSWATVNINSTFDASTRTAVVTIDGDLAPGFDGIMGEDAKLTVFITEDGLVASQVSGGANYVHNNVTRKALGSVKGNEIKKVGNNKYKNEYTFTVPSTWKADNLNVVAFISRPLGNKLKDIYVTNTNKRKFGEFDEPTSLRGDVNMDGDIDISDVTRLIDVVLGLTVEHDPVAADCNIEGGNGSIDISDVTALINRVLMGTW